MDREFMEHVREAEREYERARVRDASVSPVGFDGMCAEVVLVLDERDVLFLRSLGVVWEL